MGLGGWVWASLCHAGKGYFKRKRLGSTGNCYACLARQFKSRCYRSVWFGDGGGEKPQQITCMVLAS
ncbi:hypothetical protein CEK71_12945 [Methylovulum psychrotolerans]|uniref:Uncharacterized protein n=1 Tax=Methylovulum psychrotolerans TaxID=1704499 RepID=A0A1Z4C058_9GAMM|nr:hypothetical protein CEK71_12945 [Methylovulum psychrotolerans]